MSNRKKKPAARRNKRIPFILLFTGLSIALAGTAAAGFHLRRDQASGVSDTTRSAESTAGEPVREKWQEGVISYQGRHYKYNNRLRTYLLMGIDKDGPALAAEDGISGGQSDALFLIVADSEEKTISLVSIHRNTITKIQTQDKDGVDTGEIDAQLCVQYGFGDGRHQSCSRTADAVSYLFYNLPISGYLSIHMGAIPALNDSVGGVEVSVLQNLSYPEKGVELRAGEKRTLSGTEAYYYLRGRDINEFDSATHRLRRQEQYITAYMGKLKTAMAGNPDKAAELYDSVSEYLVTDADFVNLVSELITYEYDGSRMYTVPGETRMGEEFEEFHADDAALYDLVLQVFYEEIGS